MMSSGLECGALALRFEAGLRNRDLGTFGFPSLGLEFRVWG